MLQKLTTRKQTLGIYILISVQVEYNLNSLAAQGNYFFAGTNLDNFCRLKKTQIY